MWVFDRWLCGGVKFVDNDFPAEYDIVEVFISCVRAFFCGSDQSTDNLLFVSIWVTVFDLMIEVCVDGEPSVHDRLIHLLAMTVVR